MIDERSRSKREALDTHTQRFLAENPLLAAKILCLEGLRSFHIPVPADGMAVLTPGQKEAQRTKHADSQLVQASEAALVAVLAEHEDRDAIAQAALLWRSGFPPTAEEFSPEEHAVLDELNGQCDLVTFAHQFVPKTGPDVVQG